MYHTADSSELSNRRIAKSINHHAARDVFSGNSGAQFSGLFINVRFAGSHNMRFETLVEIGGADDGVHDGCDDQKDGDNGEEGQ